MSKANSPPAERRPWEERRGSAATCSGLCRQLWLPGGRFLESVQAQWARTLSLWKPRTKTSTDPGQPGVCDARRCPARGPGHAAPQREMEVLPANGVHATRALGVPGGDCPAVPWRSGPEGTTKQRRSLGSAGSWQVGRIPGREPVRAARRRRCGGGRAVQAEPQEQTRRRRGPPGVAVGGRVGPGA